ncbi:uncharacterized protein HKW66_Vig0112920 [Vigna angularis]|uniref:Uncharacterized protein n=1 Tax=Phaseolus angularis TaxID=3914 RepID=A0A8T0KVM4_PHAAN|nr:uncharacterized protein HKW66_Vig0112920 [Vigna angularis]
MQSLNQFRTVETEKRNDRIILFAPSLLNSGARTLELKIMNERNNNCITDSSA